MKKTNNTPDDDLVLYVKKLERWSKRARKYMDRVHRNIAKLSQRHGFSAFQVEGPDAFLFFKED